MKKNYIQPMATVVSVAKENMEAQSGGVNKVQGGTLNYGGAGTGAARTKDAGEVCDVWDDDWSQ